MEVEIIKKKENNYNNIGAPESSGRKRVAAYARVSTDLDEQKNSFQSQQKYYMDKITSNPNWFFVEVYADEGISGTQTNKRTNFMRMIKDAEEGRIDLILTKSISRFARNTLDTLNYVRALRAKNIGIIFEEENINTLDMAGELLLTVLSSVAQQESETISSHVRLGLKMKRERGELVGFNSCYGYTYNSKKNQMTIVENEAKIVRLIFEYFINGYGCPAIARILDDMKIVTPRGTGHWSENSIRLMLKNEKYTGDVIQGKTYTLDPITHKRKINNGEEDKYYIKDHHEAIISKADFEKAQEIIKRRNNLIITGRKYSARFTFSGKIRCGFCGKTYTKKSMYKKRPAWDCISVSKGAREYCPDSKIMHDDTIRSCFMEAFYLLTRNEGLAIEEFFSNIKAATKAEAPVSMKNKFEEERKKYKTQHSKLIDLFVDGKVDSETFEKKNLILQNKMEECEKKIQQLSEMLITEDRAEVRFKQIKDELLSRESSNQVKDFDEDLFNALIDYIIIGGINEKNEKESFMIRFICKKGFDYKGRDGITEDLIIDNNAIDKKDSIYNPIIDFVSNQNFYVFIKNGTRQRKTLISKVRVRVEVEK